MSANCRKQRIVNVLQRIGGAGVFGNFGGVIINNPGAFVINYIFGNGTKANGVVNLGFFLRR